MSVTLGPTAFNERDTTHFLCVPIRTVIVPITHDLVHAATVHCARQAARLLQEMTGERGTGWPNSHVVDVAVEGLVQSIHELCHATNLHPRFFRIAPGHPTRFLIDAASGEDLLVA